MNEKSDADRQMQLCRDCLDRLERGADQVCCFDIDVSHCSPYFHDLGRHGGNVAPHFSTRRSGEEHLFLLTEPLFELQGLLRVHDADHVRDVQRSAMNVAILSVLSLRFVTHDRHREGLWRRYVAHCPYFQRLRIASYHPPLNFSDRTENLTKFFYDRVFFFFSHHHGTRI